jgi:hypothetical protein
MMRQYTKKDIVDIAKRVYQELGGKESIIQRVENYKKVPKPSNVITNFYYIYQDVFDYNNLNGLLSLAVLYLDASVNNNADKAAEYGEAYKDIVVKLAEIDYLIDYTFCDKSWDGIQIAWIAHSWMYIRESDSFEAVFADEDKEIIENWLHKRAVLMYQDKDKELYESFRPYDNQEIVLGVVVLLARALEHRDPDLSQNLLELADQRLVGWKKKIGNPDDTLFYTPILVKSTYLYAVHRPKKDVLGYENCRKTFESFLQLTAPDGQVTVYNWMFDHSYPDLMALGARLFGDGRYQWMANKILSERLEDRPRRHQHAVSKMDQSVLAQLDDAEKAVIQTEIDKEGFYDHVWEGLASNVFHLWLFWDDSISPVRPDTKSVLLEKSAGHNRWPFESDPILPEKIVFRNGWEDDDLFAILNIWGGQNHPISEKIWHRYPATNEIITLNFKEPFVVQATNIMSRDVVVKREELNAFNIKRDGQWLNVHEKTYNAKVIFFERLGIADLSKTKLTNYFGWENERTCALVGGEYFVVSDYCRGAQEDDIGVLWHLKGDLEAKDRDRLKLRLFDKELSIFYPHNESWYDVRLEPSKNQNAVYQHQANVDLIFESEAEREKGFITVFYPSRGDDVEVRLAKVMYFDRDAYPLAFGVFVEDANYRDLLGVRDNDFDYPYNYDDEIITDAESFVLRQHGDSRRISFANGRLLQIRCAETPRSVVCNGRLLDEEILGFEDGYLTIRFGEFKSGTVEIGGGVRM